MQDYESRHSGEEIDDILDDVANKVDKVEGKGLSSEDFTSAEKRKLEGLENYDDTALLKDLATIQDDIADLDDIRRGAGKGATSVQGVVVNRTQLTPDSKGNISLPEIPKEADIANMGFTKNKGTVTGVMVNGESKSPNSNGVVDLGEIKVDEVKFANDLTGVVEATPEMFTYRPSAGDKSVRDESAVIRRIKGNTSAWGQYAKNPIFADGTANWESNGATLSANSNGGVNFVMTSSSSQSINQVLTDAIPKGHKVLIVIDYKRNTTTSLDVLFYLRKSNGGFDQERIFSVADSNRRVDSVIITTTDAISTTSASLIVYPMMNGASGLTAIIYSINVFDLTDIFGAGNEPTTYEEFRQYYPDAYYPYCVPEIRAMRATGVETVGFNQWDEQWENGTFNTETGENISNNQIRCKNLIRIFPNTYYSLSIGDKNVGIWAMFYDNNQNILQPINLNSSVSHNCLYISPSGNRNVFLTPENASWMKFYTPSEYGSTTYKGDICINLSHSGVRNGEYKPYEKSTLLLPEIAKYFPEGMHGIGDVCDEIIDGLAIQRCAVRAYKVGDENDVEVKTDKITNTVYKLSEPIYTPIDEPLQLDYKVDDFGTEKMLSDAPSAPFKADIVYQFNAEGRIRDNSRNIEKLEEAVKKLENNDASSQYAIPCIKDKIGALSELLPNVVYDNNESVDELHIPPFANGDSGVVNKWIVRSYVGEGCEITYPTNIRWKNGTPPTYTGIKILELIFTDTGWNEILGEWSVY